MFPNLCVRSSAPKAGFLLLWLLFSSHLLHAQVVDSLESRLALPDLPSDERIETLYLLSRELTFVDLNRSMEYAKQSLDLARIKGDEKGMAYAYRILGSIYTANDDYFMGMQSLHQSMELFGKEADSVGLANCYISMGHIYRKLQNRDKEIEYHRKSYEFFRQRGLEERLGVSAHNLGESYYLAGCLDEAEDLTQIAIAINARIGNLPVLSNCLKVQGLIELSRGQLDLAEEHFGQVMAIASNLGPNSQKQAAAESLIQLSEINRQFGHQVEELRYLMQAEALCKQYDLYDFLKRVYHRLALHHLESGNTSTATEFIRKQRETAEMYDQKLLHDRARLTEGMVQIASLSERASQLQSQTLIQTAEIQTRNYLLAVIGLCLVLLVWFASKTRSMNLRLHADQAIIMQQKAELETLNATKDKFFSVVAHDIRSPLIALKSFTSLLTENFELMTAEEVKTMGRRLDRSVDSTLGMADNLILWATDQMKKSTAAAEPVSLNNIFHNIFGVFNGVAREKEINLSVDAKNEMQVFGDRNQIEFIIRNLVNNAIKYTPRGGWVSLGVQSLDTGEVQVKVADTGVGMEEEVLQALFTLNAGKVRRGTEGEEGSGLGLTLSYEFARRNQGRIEVDSAPEKGTTFLVTLPQEGRAA